MSSGRGAKQKPSSITQSKIRITMSTLPGSAPDLPLTERPECYSDYMLSDMLASHEEMIAHHEKAAALLRAQLENHETDAA
jgi:hypothetical protein